MLTLSTLSCSRNTHHIKSSWRQKQFSRRYAAELKSEKIKSFVDQYKDLMKPKNVHVIDGSPEERQMLINQLMESKTLIKLNEGLRPNSYLARSSPGDVARVEERTLICSEDPKDAGPTNHWMDPTEMKTGLNLLMNGAMKNRTMYVIPFCMGPVSSPLSEVGVQVTDSAYVALSMTVMARAGKEVLEKIGDGDFVRCVHTVGYPLNAGEEDVSWPCNPVKYITHFPETKEIMSFGSGYGGNALLGKKCYALRIASIMAKENGWLAEHMLILGISNPEGRKIYIAAAFPSACGKTNLAMLMPTIPGWSVETVGDDIAWMKYGEDGQLYAINPENGFFGVAPGTSNDSNPMAMKTVESNTIFTNVGLTEDNDVWWEGMTKQPPAGVIDWHGNKWDPNSGKPVAHPNSRFCVGIDNSPSVDPSWDSAKGVPISAIIFGGRRATTVPLVYEATSWEHGVFIGSSIASETTAAQVEGNQGALRHDPFAMLPFCGYNMGDYFSHWLEVGKNNKRKPKIFGVNWFRKDEDGFIWPGFGENSRVLKWIFERCEGQVGAIKTPIGYLPEEEDLDIEGLDISEEKLRTLLSVEKEGWINDVENIRQFYSKFGDRMPKELIDQLDSLKNRLQ
eukprot:TRINITY_DN1794_c0_g1_i1.p1 TRINITY_DN1794_c0_g1~~TRINITY_DN1794_c0_g1_i1.p1  ORF type:complete len:622 (-),score=157.88 TRINITY_DN1794_c0_g1_i1:6-1871(-)